MVALRNGGPPQGVRGFALMARRDIFSSGISHPQTPAPKRKLSGLITSAVFVDFNIQVGPTSKHFLTSK